MLHQQHLIFSSEHLSRSLDLFHAHETKQVCLEEFDPNYSPQWSQTYLGHLQHSHYEQYHQAYKSIHTLDHFCEQD